MTVDVCTCVRMKTVKETCYLCNGTGQVEMDGQTRTCWACGGSKVVELKAKDPNCPMHGEKKGR